MPFKHALIALKKLDFSSLLTLVTLLRLRGRLGLSLSLNVCLFLSRVSLRSTLSGCGGLDGALSLDILSLGFFLPDWLANSFLLLNGSSLDGTNNLKLLVDSLLLSDSVLLSSGLSLLSELLLSDLLLLHLVDGFDQDTLVLELVTLGRKIEVMVAVEHVRTFKTILTYLC